MPILSLYIRCKVSYRIGYHPLRTPSRIVTSKEVTEPARQRPFRQRIIDKDGYMRTGLPRRNLEAHSIAANHQKSGRSGGLPDFAAWRRSLRDDLLYGKRNAKNFAAEPNPRADFLAPSGVELDLHRTSTRHPRRFAHMRGQARVIVHVGKNSLHQRSHHRARFIVIHVSRAEVRIAALAKHTSPRDQKVIKLCGDCGPQTGPHPDG